MVRSIRPSHYGLTCLLAATAVSSARGFDDKPPARPAESGIKAAGEEGGQDDSKAARPRFLALPGEDAPKPFVPVNPRTIEDRKRLEAITAYSVARALEDKRAWSEAVSLLEEALKLDPDSITILRRLSRLSFVLGRTEAGIKYCKRVLEADPGDTDTITRLVGYYKRRNDPTGAESVLEDVLANPKLERNAAGRLIAEFELGKLFAGKLKQVDKAADAFARVVDALDEKSANKLSQADQRRILGGDEAAAYMEFGLTFLQAKRHELAIKAFERGLDYEPDDPQIPLLLARTYLKVNKGEQALSQVERFLKRQPHELEGYELLTEVLTALNRQAEITPRLEQAAKNDSKNVALQYALADRYRETGQVERAEEMYRTLLATQPTTQGYGALASSLLKRRKVEELLKVLADAYKNPASRDSVQETIKAIVDDPELTDKVFEAGLKLLSTDPPGLDKPGVFVLAQIATQSSKPDKLLPIQQLALKQNPTAQTYREVLALQFTLKRYDEAASTLEEMLKKFPEERNARQVAELALIYRLADKPEEAVRNAHEALKLDPNDAEVGVEVARVLSQSGKVDEAIELLRKAVKKDPANPGPNVILGSILAQAGRNDEALALFKGLLEKYPNNDDVVKIARSNLSIVYVNLGDYAKGEAELEILLERNPDEVGFNNDLGYLYAEQGKNLEKAEVMIRKAVQEEPENPAYLDSLGWVLFKRGKIKEAVEPLENAVKQLSKSASSGDATIYEHLGDVYFQLHETAKAKGAWTSAEKFAAKASPPDKRLPEIRKKLESLEKLGQAPKPSTGDTP